MTIEPIAYYHSALSTKFGAPRQSGLVPELRGRIVFEQEYRNADALRGIEGFDFLWLVWGFSLNERKADSWSPLVRPPLLGGNRSMGVFATRSPFRPNPLGLSSVRMLGVEDSAEGVVLIVGGADLVDGTPIYDIKPYIAYSDAHPDARGGFVETNNWSGAEVVFPDELRRVIPDEDYKVVVKLLCLDPRPRYHNDPERVYGMPYGGYDIRFTVSDDGVLRVVEVIEL